MTKNGSEPSSGRALATPPPVSSRSASMHSRKRGRAAAGDVSFDHRSEMVGVDHDLLDALRVEGVDDAVEHRSPADFDQRLRKAIGDRSHPRTEAGRQHHRPARRSIRRPILALGHTHVGSRRRLPAPELRHVPVEPARQGSQSVMRQRPLEQPPDARDVCEIRRLAVPPGEAGEDADHLGVPLRRQDGECALEASPIGAANPRGVAVRASPPSATATRRGARPPAAT